MREELEKKLKDKYPTLFQDTDASMTMTCMCWGIETLDGWYDLIDKCCAELSEKYPEVKLVQVKEKFGGLRIYLDSYPGDSFEITGKYENLSYKTCEICGSTEGVKTTSGWLMVRCAECLKKLEEKNGYPAQILGEEDYDG